MPAAVPKLEMLNLHSVPAEYATAMKKDARRRNGANASDTAADKPVASARSAKQPGTRVADHATPIRLTTILGREKYAAPCECPSPWTDGTLDKSIVPGRGALLCLRHAHKGVVNDRG